MKPSIPKGMRDFSAIEVARRNYIFDTIRSVFRLYGYQPIETPTMENLSSLLGKYGDEGDKLLFKVLNSGEFNKNVDFSAQQSPQALANRICEKGLRYDLTVPFARYVVQHYNELSFPFKRFQIQPVWRADRPQKGRYREFYQCDADVVGSNSLLYEAELIEMVQEVFRRLKINIRLKVNNRKILSGIASYIGHPDKLVDITVAIDKLDKIGLDGVREELLSKGLSEADFQLLSPILALEGDNTSKLDLLESILAGNQQGLKGIEELRQVLVYAGECASIVDIDLSLARGLSYYTGAIFEVKAQDYAIGSISGGGRYDNLTGIFGMPGLSGVGISFGADRIYDVLDGLNLFPADISESTKALFVNFGGEELKHAISLARELRSSGIAAEIYPSCDKLKKQFDWAGKKHIPYMVFIGETEIAEKVATVKNIEKGNQFKLAFDKFSEEFKNL